MESKKIQGINCYNYETVMDDMTNGEIRNFRDFMRTREFMIIDATRYIYSSDLSDWNNTWCKK